MDFLGRVFNESRQSDNLIRAFLFIMMLSALYNVNLPLDPKLPFLKDDKGNYTCLGLIYALFGIVLAVGFSSMFFTSMRT